MSFFFFFFSFLFLSLRLTQKLFNCHSSFFFLVVTFYGRTAKSFLANVLTSVNKKMCDGDMTYSLATPNHISVNIASELVIRDVFGTWHGLYV